MRRRTALKSLFGATAAVALPAATARPADGYAPMGRVDLREAAEAVVDDAGDTAYVATVDGFATVDVSDPANPRKLAHQTVMADYTNGPLGGIADCSLDGDRLLVGGPYNGGGFKGIALFDVSDPASPGRILAKQTGFSHHNLTYRDGTAYLTRGGDGTHELLLADLSDGEYRERGTWDLLDHDEGWADVDDAGTFIHDLWPQDDRVYLARWDAGTFVVDVSDPDAPETVAKVGGYPLSELQTWSKETATNRFIEPPGNHHFATVNDDASLLAVGKEAWDIEETEGGGPAGVELWDITDPVDAELLSTIAPPPSPDPTFEQPDTTAHNLELHGDRLFTSWYHGGVKVHDISDPADPEQLTWWRRPSEACFWTAQRASDDCFVASSTSIGNRTTWSGLYTFPNAAGEQVDPPGTFTDAGTPASETATPTGSPSDGTPTADGRSAGDETPTDESADESPTDTPATAPGFGLLGAVGGATIAAWRRARR